MIATVTLNPSLDEWVELPSLKIGALQRATSFARYPGGKGLNVSRVVHELGERTRAFGIAGGDDGTILRALIRRLAIRQEFVSVEGSTRNNYKLLTRRPPLVTEINTPGPRVSRAVLAALEGRLFQRRPAPEVLVLSGSVPPGAPAAIYRRWITACKRLEIPAALDASGAALHEGIQAKPWFIKPNLEEAAELLGMRLRRWPQRLRAVRRLLAMGPSVVVLSMGKEGALLGSSQARTIWIAHAPAVKTRSTVGAGDSLVGGFLVGWIRRWPLVEAFRLGVACGTAAVTTAGTELCHRADVERLVPRVKIQPIDSGSSDSCWQGLPPAGLHRPRRAGLSPSSAQAGGGLPSGVTRQQESLPLQGCAAAGRPLTGPSPLPEGWRLSRPARPISGRSRARRRARRPRRSP